MIGNRLKQDLHFLDPGIDLQITQANGGTLITLMRQGHSTKWTLWVSSDGTVLLRHPETSTLREVDLEFPPGSEPLLLHTLRNFVEGGLI